MGDWTSMRERWMDADAEGPYCLRCSTMQRMERTDEGFFCNPETPCENDLALRRLLPGVALPPIRFGCGQLIPGAQDDR